MILGYSIFDEMPSITMMIGTLVIIASGMFIIIREKKIGIIK
jgi:drug/metabolite transporter (DMT)-like permease